MGFILTSTPGARTSPYPLFIGALLPSHRLWLRPSLFRKHQLLQTPSQQARQTEPFESFPLPTPHHHSSSSRESTIPGFEGHSKFFSRSCCNGSAADIPPITCTRQGLFSAFFVYFFLSHISTSYLHSDDLECYILHCFLLFVYLFFRGSVALLGFLRCGFIYY